MKVPDGKTTWGRSLKDRPCRVIESSDKKVETSGKLELDAAMSGDGMLGVVRPDGNGYRLG